jgi:hypothetical protein
MKQWIPAFEGMTDKLQTGQGLFIEGSYPNFYQWDVFTGG